MSARHEEVAHRLTIDEIKAINASLAAALAKAMAEAMTEEADAFSLATFCRRHSISLPTFYRLVTQDIAPETFQVGSRVLVSKEAAARWRAKREVATAAEAEAAKFEAAKAEAAEASA